MTTLATPLLRAAKVFVTSAYADPEPVGTFLKFAHQDRVKTHTLVDDPAEADIILFIEHSHYVADYFFSQLRNHPLVKKYPGKVFMYNPHDRPWYVLPGLYMCMPKQRFSGAHMAAGAYIETINPYITCSFGQEPELLFSFYGATTSAPRLEVAKLTHPRGEIIISNVLMYVDNRPEDLQTYYAALLTNSKFVLCPAGAGPSSIRLFEVMKAGRVPVIISDNLVYPKGPAWDKFAVIVPEDRIADIPAILERQEPLWPEKSRLARLAWEEFFAPDTLFNYYVDSILALDANSTIPVRIGVTHAFVYFYYVFRKTIVRRIKLLPNLLRGINKRQ